MTQIESNTNVENKDFNVLSADNPLKNPEHDRLGYAPFAKNLAESICKMAPPQGFVMAVYAPWGLGKSTLLNFIIHYLEQKPESEQPLIVPFNPWWFSGQEDLTRHFFDQLLAVLSTKLKSFSKEMKERLEDFAHRVSRIPGISIVEAIAKSSNPVVEPAMLVFNSLMYPKDVSKLKEDIEKELKNQQKRILVVIDDIDRLTAEEIRQLFRVIKAVANFPNVVYLLLFDREVVVKALSEVQRMSGEAYLEKIVQVPFELPLPDKISLRRLLDKQLSEILTGTPEQLFDQAYWRKVYFAGIEHFITTPRNIVRLINTLRVTYPIVKGEVNAVDFIAIETLRVFCPLIYDIIRHNHELFIGYMGYLTSSSFFAAEERKGFHNSWIQQVNEKDVRAVQSLLIEMFPTLKAVMEKTNFLVGNSEKEKWRKQLRICSPDIDIFLTYFRLEIPEGSISNTEMKALLALTKYSQKFGEKLVELATQIRPDGTTRVRVFLERIEDYITQEISLDSIPSILQALFEVGDQLWCLEDEQNSFFNNGNETQIELIITKLLERLQQPQRFEILRDAISNGKAISTIAWEVRALGIEHGKYESQGTKPEEERLINEQQLKELQELALQKVREAVEQDSLLQAPQLRTTIFYLWQHLSDRNEICQWVQRIIQEDKKLVQLIENFHKYDKRFNLDPHWFKPYLEPSQIINRVRDLADDINLAENQRIALRKFIQGYDLKAQEIAPNTAST